MSKKNNKSIMARKHAHDLALEKAAQEKAKKQQERSVRKKERQLAATGAVKTKRKGIKLKKGFKVKGIKITDAESKKQVLAVLKQEQAEKLMEVEGPAAEQQQDRKKKKPVGSSKLRVARKKLGSSSATSGSGKSNRSGGADAPAPMEA